MVMFGVHDPAFKRKRFEGLEGGLGWSDLAGAAHLELLSGVTQLRPERVLDLSWEALSVP
jgi:hypothetical protein